MATIVNNPTPVVEDRSNHTGLLIATIVLLGLAALLFFGYNGTQGTADTGSGNAGIERGVGGGADTGTEGNTIQVPDQIDVNVNDQRDGQ